MEKISQELLWETLLSLKNEIAADLGQESYFSLIFKNDKCSIKKGIEKDSPEQKSIIVSRNQLPEVQLNSVYFILDQYNNLLQTGESFLDIDSTNFLKQYLPYCYSSLIAREINRPYSILHLAQSIDGRIATQSGNSKWVSNHENLIHSHRMRALCDAILIGKNTLLCDSPMLTVRHVSGTSPVRVVIANSPCNFDNLKKSKGKIILFTSKETTPVDGIEIINIPDISGNILSELILKELYKRNINSIFIEGGAITASYFISAHLADRVQIFISPKIFGSGINSFSLPPIDIIEKSINFVKASFIPMGDGVLFDGTPLNNAI